MVDQYSDYQVNEDGSIVSLKKVFFGRVMKFRLDKNGYCIINICIDGKKITEKVHRMVAKAHIPNPNNYPEVNHKDGISGTTQRRTLNGVMAQ